MASATARQRLMASATARQSIAIIIWRLVLVPRRLSVRAASSETKNSHSDGDDKRANRAARGLFFFVLLVRSSVDDGTELFCCAPKEDQHVYLVTTTNLGTIVLHWTRTCLDILSPFPCLCLESPHCQPRSLPYYYHYYYYCHVDFAFCRHDY